MLRIWNDYRTRANDQTETDTAARLLGADPGPRPLLDDLPAALVVWAPIFARMEQEIAEESDDLSQMDRGPRVRGGDRQGRR